MIPAFLVVRCLFSLHYVYVMTYSQPESQGVFCIFGASTCCERIRVHCLIYLLNKIRTVRNGNTVQRGGEEMGEIIEKKG